MKQFKEMILFLKLILLQSSTSMFMPTFSSRLAPVFIISYPVLQEPKSPRKLTTLLQGFKSLLGTIVRKMIQLQVFLACFCIVFLNKQSQCRFRHLSPAQRKITTAIKNPSFLQNFCNCLTSLGPNTSFHLESGKVIQNRQSNKDIYFQSLLREIRIAWCSEPVLYFTEEALETSEILEWLDKISNSKLFEYNCDGEDNLLWFSPKTFRPLSHALANQIQKQISRCYYQKINFYDQILELKQFAIKNSISVLTDALEIPMYEFIARPEKDLHKILERIRIQEDKLHAINAEKLFLQMESNPKMKRNKRKGKKKGQNYINRPIELQQSQSVFVQQRRDTLHDSVKVDNAKNIQPVQNENPQGNVRKQMKAKYVQKDQGKYFQLDNRKFVSLDTVLSSEKDQQIFKQSNSDKQQSTNENERSVSKSQSTSQLQQVLHSEQISQESPQPSEDLRQDKIRKRRKRRVKRQHQVFQELKKEICHKFMTRQLENISQLINSSTNKMLEARIVAFERARILVQNNFPLSNAILFGSNAIGLALPASDVDILLVGFQCISRNDSAELLNQVGYLFSCMGWAINYEIYANAKVPVLKLQIDTSIPFMQLKGTNKLYQADKNFVLQTDKEIIVKVDITVNVEGLSSTGYDSTLLMKKWLEKYPFSQKIVILFKHLLSYRNLNENYRGGIGSYCLFVMIMAFIHENPQSVENELSRVFLDVLVWYSETFDHEKQIVWLRQDGSSFVTEEQYQQIFGGGEQRRGLLRLVDPTTSRIMSGSCSQYIKVKEFFRQILDQLNKIQELIVQQLKDTSENLVELTRMFQNRRQSQKWFRNADQRHSWALKSLLGING